MWIKNRRWLGCGIRSCDIRSVCRICSSRICGISSISCVGRIGSVRCVSRISSIGSVGGICNSCVRYIGGISRACCISSVRI